MDPEQIDRILIVRTDRLGDVVLTTPSIKALRDHFPRAHITVLIAPGTRPLVEGNPHVDAVIVDDRKKDHRGLMGFFRLIRSIRHRHFDLAIVFHTKRRTNLLCFLAGIRHRLGYRNDKFGFLLNHSVKDERVKGTRHEAQYCLDLLKPLGIECEHLETFISIGVEASDWAGQLFQKEGLRSPIATVHAGASDPSKQWPPEYFVEVIEHLAERHGCRIVLIGTADQRGVVSEIQKKTGLPFLDMTGRTSVTQLAALLQRCDILVSNDSGPVHLADAVQTPVVSIFTRNQPGINPERWRPLSSRSRWVAPPTGRHFFPQGRVSNPAELKIIGPQEVIDAVDAVFKLC